MFNLFRMIRFVLIIALLGGVAQSVQSQADTSLFFKNGFYIEDIYRFSNQDQLNRVLNNAGISGIHGDFIGLSLGVSSRYSDRNSYVIAQLSFLGSEMIYSKSPSRNASIYVLELSTEMHWVLSKSPKWLIYPYYGFGMGNSILGLTDTATDLTFSNGMSGSSDGGKRVEIYLMDWPLIFVNSGIGIERRIRISQNVFFIGIGLGYRLSTRSHWGGSNDLPMTGFSGYEIKWRIRFETVNKLVSKKRPGIYREVH